MCEKKTKVCSRCKEEKPITEFSKNKSTKDGHSYECRNCKKKYAKKWREKNQEKIRARNKKRYEENREKERVRQKKYREENREKERARQKKYREENREKVKARDKKYREENREKIRARYKENWEKIRARQKKWDKENPEKRRLIGSKRRARLREAKIEVFSHKDLLEFWNENKINPQECFYCKKEMPEGPEHIDHYIPLIKGGTHERENLRPSCASCNLSKHAKHPEIFMEELKNSL